MFDSVLGTQCAANADCSDTVINSVCDTGDTSTCICSDGYNANDANTACDLGKYILLQILTYKKSKMKFI